MKRIVSFLLALILTVSVFSVPAEAAAVENEALKAEVKRQLDAYADTIDVEDAGDQAVEALLEHATDRTGRDLWVGPDHPLTAAILNSASFNYGIAEALSVHMTDGEDSIIMLGQHSWYSSKAPAYRYRPNGSKTDTVKGSFTGKTNAYDEDLALVVGGSRVRMQATKTAVGTHETTWNIHLFIYDAFDFNANYDKWKVNATTEKLLTFIGKLLEGGGTVEPFNWYSYASVELTIPNELLVPVESEETEPEETKPESTAPDGKTAIANYAAAVTPADAAEGTITTLFTHAYAGQGKDLTLDSNSPIMGSILSSNLFQDAFSRIFTSYLKYGEESVRFEGTLTYDRQQKYFKTAENNLGFKKSTKYSSRYIANSHDMLLCLVGTVDFTLTFTATTADNGETIYRADISVADRFDKNDEDLKAIITGVGGNSDFMKLLTSYNWSGTAGFTLNDYV